MEGVPPYPPALKNEYKQKGWWSGHTLTQLFDRTCDTYADKEAIVEGRHRLTFSQLRQKTEQAARAFSRLGIGNRDRVLLQVPNWVEAVYAYLGLQRVGAIPVMCLPRHGLRELEGFCALTQPKAWIGPPGFGKTDYLPAVKAIRDRFSSLEHAIVVRGEAPPGMASFSQLMEDKGEVGVDGREYTTPADPDGVVHLAPTGGTTGLPKLVPKTHNNDPVKARHFARILEIGPQSVGLVFSPLNHDGPHALNLCMMLLTGCKTVLCPSTRIEDIVEHIDREKVTYCFFVPALLTDFLHKPDLHKYDLSSLQTVVIGGARCPPELVKLVFSQLRCRPYNCWGMTEGAGTITRKEDPWEVVAQTVGKAVCPYDEYRAIDDRDREVPRGEEGEIAARGPAIVSGYYKSEEENKQVFTPDGFFRTGDLGRFDKDGNLVITGRKKDIINRGGEKVSAIDVEDMILSHPGVLRAAAIGMPDRRLGERICAYIQPKFGQRLDATDMLTYLKDKGASLLLLPERIEFVSELPLTAMDKIDKRKLREDIALKVGKDQTM